MGYYVDKQLNVNKNSYDDMTPEQLEERMKKIIDDYDYIFKISNNKEVDTIFIGRYAIFLGIIKLNMRENNKIYKSTHNEYDSVYNINSLTLNEKNVSIKVENKNRFILLSYL